MVVYLPVCCFNPGHTLFVFSQVALAALPCLSCAGPEPIRSRAEALFRRLSFLDGDGVWLLLLQTMDTAAQQPNAQLQQLQQQQRQQQQRAALGAARAPTTAGRKGSGSRSSAGNQVVAAPGAVASRRGVGPRASLAAGNKEENNATIGDSGPWWWLPSVPAPSALQGAASVVGVSSRRRPAGLFEGRAVFGGGAGRVAGECAPAAARLLGSLGADGAVAEHM